MKILVIGDTMRDEYWQGTASRLSPVAPVPVVSVTSTEQRAGAAANVAANIEALGVPCERIFGGGERIRKITVRANAHYFARLDFDYPQEPIWPDAAFLEAAERCDLIVAMDYGKGALGRIADLIKATDKPFLIDPKGHDYERYRGAALIKPNRDEMRELVGGWSSQDELDFKARQFLVAAGVGSILLTQAAEGMRLYTRTETWHHEAQNAAPVDVSGAGEAALSAYAVALAQDLTPPERVACASKAAAIAISRHGTVVCTREEVFGPR